MAETVFKHFDKDLETLKRDVALIKHILCEEGSLTDYAKKAIKIARVTPRAAYISHAEVKRRILRK